MEIHHTASQLAISASSQTCTAGVSEGFWLVLRCAKGNQPEEVCFVDPAWAGEEGQARYPGFLNLRANWPLANAEGQLITQILDRTQLQSSISMCEEAAAKRQRGPRAVQPPRAISGSRQTSPGLHRHLHNHRQDASLDVEHLRRRHGQSLPMQIVTTWGREKHIPTSWVPFDIFSKPIYDRIATFPPMS